MLIAAALLYATGLRRMRTRGRDATPPLAAFAFAAGLLVAAAAVLLVERVAADSLAAHMGQHMLLLAVAPPLLVAGRPGIVYASLLPAVPRRRLHRWRPRDPLPAAAVQAVVVWAWHAPPALDLALRSAPAHALMHLSFLACGLYFWAAIADAAAGPRPDPARAILALLVTMMPMGLLGALLSFSSQPWYACCVRPPAGLTPLEDQQLAGLIMWVPGAVPYILGGLAWLAAALVARSPPSSDDAASHLGRRIGGRRGPA